jgi:hypothetical protein
MRHKKNTAQGTPLTEQRIVFASGQANLGVRLLKCLTAIKLVCSNVTVVSIDDSGAEYIFREII